MAARRLVIVLLVLLGLSTLAAALVPVQQPGERDEEASAPPTTPRQAPRQRDSELITERIDASEAEGEPQRIALSPGDQLQLTVVAPKPDQVAIPALGELADVGPDTPAVFDLIANAPGEYPVRLVDADRVVARLVVGTRADEAEPPPRPTARLDERTKS